MKRLDLRPYQSEGVRDIRRALKDARSTIWICPTGGGKSRVFCAIANGWRGRVLVLADRISLVDQAADNLATFTNRRVGIERAEERTDRANLPAVVCSTVQTMTRRAREFPPDTFGLIIVDEADLALAPSYRRIFDRFHGAKILGVTATPDRHDGKPLGDLFDTVAGTVEIAALIRAGYLSRIRQYLTHIESVELDTAGVSGDFNAESLGRILSAERPLHEVARPTMDQAGDRPTIVFAASIKHAEALAGVFNRYRKGCARVIHSQQEEDDGAIRESFARREFQFLINVAMLTRGIDLPLTACVVMARPTLSRPLYAQMIGRGTRPDKGKRDLMVLDFAGNAGRHSLISVVDVLGADRDEETKERARERLEHGGDVLDEIDAAEEEIKADSATRERVRAKVRARIEEVIAYSALHVDWSAIFTSGRAPAPDIDIAKKLGVSREAVSAARQRRKILPFKGRLMDNGLTLSELSRQSGLPYTTVRNRFKSGLRGDDLIAQKLSSEERGRRISIGHKNSSRSPKIGRSDGVPSLSQLSAETGLSKATIATRRRAGWTIEEMMSPRVSPRERRAHADQRLSSRGKPE